MKYTVILTLILVFSGLIFADNIEVLNQTEDAVTLRFTLPDYSITSVRKEGRQYDVIECEDAISEAAEGTPVLPFFSEVIGLPSDGEMHISILNSQREYSDNIKVIPQEKIVPTDDSYNKVFYIDNAVYSTSKFIPAQSVVNAGTALYRNWKFGTLRINPFRYNPLSRRLEITTTMDIQVNISGTKTVSNTLRSNNIPGIDMISGLAVNGDISRNWMKPIENINQNNHTRSAARSNDIQEIQIIVNSDGIYKVFYQDLVDSLSIKEGFMGGSVFDWSNIDPRNLELYDENGIVPIHFPGELDGQFSRGEYFEFYGEFHRGETCYYDDYTYENVYTLKVVPYYGARMAVENGGLQVTNPSDYISPRAFRQTVHYEKQLQYQKLGYSQQNNREDRFFWSSITAPNLLTIPFDLQYPYEAGTRYFDAKVVLFGATHNSVGHPDHHAVVRINSTLIGSEEWYQQYERVFENDTYLSNTYLNHGTNNLYISLPGVEDVSEEQVLLDYFELDYWRMYKTDEDYIKFTKPSNRPTGLYQFDLQYFSSEDVSVYKLGSSIMENIEIIPAENDTVFEVQFQDDVLSDDVNYYAVTEANKKRPVNVRYNYPSNLKSEENNANYIIITGESLIDCDGTKLLHDTWEQYDMSVYGYDIEVEVVSVQDIYDEFNHGIESAQALKDFFSYVFNNWNNADELGFSLFTHALLLGEGIYDQSDYSLNRKYDIVPPIYVWTDKHGATPSDNAYACVIGSDIVPDFSIGRLNVYTEDHVEAVARKTLRFITEPQTQDLWTNHVVLCAGGKADDTDDLFSRQSESLRKGFIDASFDVNRVYIKTITVPDVYRGNTSTLLENINNGALFVQFMGHGGGQTWDDNDLLNIDHIESFTNNIYPFVSSMSCYGSSFDSPGITSSMGEALTVHSNGGAIAHVGFSGLGYEKGDEYFARYMFDALFYRNLGNVGSIVDFAKTKISLRGTNSYTPLSEGCILHGDPMIKFTLPERNINIEISDFTPEEGDTITVSATFPSNVVGARVNVCAENELPLSNFYEVSTPNGILSYQYIVPTNFSEDDYLRQVRVIGYSYDNLYSGYSEFFVGDETVFDSRVEPPTFSVYDSLYISAQVAFENGFQEIYVITEYDSSYTSGESTIVVTNTLEEINMEYSSEDGRYRSERPLRVLRYDTEVKYHFRVVKSNGTEVNFWNENRIFEVNCADLMILAVEVITMNEKPALKVQMKNQGKLASEATRMLIEVRNSDGLHQINVDDIPPLQVNQIYIRTIDLSGITSEGNIVVEVNPDQTFIETEYDKNDFTLNFDMNLFWADEEGATVLSPDGNISCTIPSGIFERDAMGSVSRRFIQESINQEDIESIVMGGDNTSIAYEVFMIDEEFYADSLKTVPNNGSMSLSFTLDPTDSLTALGIVDNKVAVYRWEDDFEKWIFQGGLLSRDGSKITKEVTKFGTYAVFINNDREKPVVKANVENQEFTHGGYISGTGIISFVLSDGNGIDVFDNRIRMFLNGDKIDNNDYTIAASKGNLTHIPLKYKLNLDKGEYNLIVDCQDVNGNFSEHKIQFIVNNHFDVINVGNYPNPVITKTYESENSGRTRFTYVLTDDADYVSIRVYTVSGRLVKSFNDIPSAVGYHEYPRTIKGWDCRDEHGRELANGVYFYRVTARKGGKTIKKTEKMAILK